MKGNKIEKFKNAPQKDVSQHAFDARYRQSKTTYIYGVEFLPEGTYIENKQQESNNKGALSLSHIERNYTPHFSIQYDGCCAFDDLLSVFPKVAKYLVLHGSAPDGIPDGRLEWASSNGYFMLSKAREGSQKLAEGLQDHLGISSERVAQIIKDEAIRTEQDFLEKILKPELPRFKILADELILIMSNQEAALEFFGKKTPFRFFSTATHGLSPYIK